MCPPSRPSRPVSSEAASRAAPLAATSAQLRASAAQRKRSSKPSRGTSTPRQRLSAELGARALAGRAAYLPVVVSTHFLQVVTRWDSRGTLLFKTASALGSHRRAHLATALLTARTLPVRCDADTVSLHSFFVHASPRLSDPAMRSTAVIVSHIGSRRPSSSFTPTVFISTQLPVESPSIVPHVTQLRTPHHRLLLLHHSLLSSGRIWLAGSRSHASHSINPLVPPRSSGHLLL